MVFGYFRKEISREIIGICTLVHVNQNFSDELLFHICGSGYICHFYSCKYLYTSTCKAIKKFYRTTFPSDIIFIKSDSSISYEQVEELIGELNIHYRACIGSLIYLFSTRLYFTFAVHKLAKFSANPGKVYLKVWYIY